VKVKLYGQSDWPVWNMNISAAGVRICFYYYTDYKSLHFMWMFLCAGILSQLVTVCLSIFKVFLFYQWHSFACKYFTVFFFLFFFV